MRNITRALAALAGSAVIGIGAAAPAFAANTISATTGTLIAKGVSAAVPVTYTCQPGEYNYITISLRQWVNRTTVNAGGSNIGYQPCTASPTTVSIVVNSPDGQRLKKGNAASQISLFNCDVNFIDCTAVYVAGVVKLK